MNPKIKNEEENLIKISAQEMEECADLWDELKDWNIILKDKTDN